MNSRIRFRSFAAGGVVLLALLPQCSIDRAPAGLRATPPGSGPQVVFDLERRPLPEIPQPNDVATFPDPTSRTGRRINVSVVAPTAMEEFTRHGFGQMEGWGTFAPITVAFQREPGADPAQAAIDLDDVRRRMQHDAHDFKDDPIYVIDLQTGLPAMLDMGDGNFPESPRDLDLYWPNDPKVNEQNVLFESVEEGAGLPQSAYTPALDLDFDGVLDHPNTLGPLPPGGVSGVDDLLTWYERETDTLIARPLLPLEEKTTYAVVITDRLHGPDGQPVRSPFTYVNHPEQTGDLARVTSILSDPARANYFGDLAGTGASHVSFAWTFTTQPVYEDLRLLRDGLYGKGPFGYLATRFPAKAEAMRAAGMADDPANEVADVAGQPGCDVAMKAPFAVNVPASQSMMNLIVSVVLKREFTLSASQQLALEKSLTNVDHFVIGQFKSPYLIGDDPAHEDPEDWFKLDFKTGAGRVTSDTVPFFMAIPKATANAAQPFPTVMWSHGTSLFGAESILRVGYFAAQGVATVAIDMPGHGLYLDDATSQLAEIVLRGGCYVEWINALKASRAYDLNGDGVPDSGGLLWSSHLFHSRDNIRQSVVDQMQAVRIIHGFDGSAMSDQDYNGDGKNDLAGDFDGDGTPDLGGARPVYTSGDSYGGIVAMIHGAVDPYVTAAAPISGGAGLALDVAAHSSLVPTAVLEQTLSPLIIAVPASSRDASAGLPSACKPEQLSLRFEVNDLTKSRELEIACLDPSEITKRTVVVSNLRNLETRCARTDGAGLLRIPVPSNVGDRLWVQIYDRPDAVDSYASCNPIDSANLTRTISTWEQAAQSFATTADGSTCPGSCQQFRSTFYIVGSPLVSPQEGFGYGRQTPDFRRLLTLSQSALDVSDPVNFAPYYMLKPAPGLDGQPLPPRGVLVSNTVGDPYVPIGAGISFARAAGAVPFLPPGALQTMPEYADYVTPEPLMSAFGDTPNDMLLKNHVVRGLARLGQTQAGSHCGVNALANPSSDLQCGPIPAVDPSTCAHTLYDADWPSGGANLLDAPHPATPLRLGRRAARATDAASLLSSWEPRIAPLDPHMPDAAPGDTPLLGLVNAYVNPLGEHVFVIPDPCRAFDDVTYYDTMLVHYLATNGTDIYPLSHPATHMCMATQSCPFFP